MKSLYCYFSKSSVGCNHLHAASTYIDDNVYLVGRKFVPVNRCFLLMFWLSRRLTGSEYEFMQFWGESEGMGCN